eukprot:6953654-Alexandrium_andersonii.AAC.1
MLRARAAALAGGGGGCGAGAGGGGGGQDIHPRDWHCPACFDLQFAQNTSRAPPAQEWHVAH